MTMKTNSLEAFLHALCAAKRIVLFSHVNPDGDTVGAATGLRLALMRLGKETMLICDGDVPADMRFLEGTDAYLKPEEARIDGYDTALAVDVSSPDMLGEAQPLFERMPCRLVIDHHATNPLYGDVHFVRGGESSCCLLAYEAISALGVPVDVPMATSLLLGMSTDTGHFQYSYTSPETLEAAAQLVRVGANLSDIARRMYRTQPMRKVRLTRIAYDSLRFMFDGQVGVIVLRAEDFAATGCSFGEADGLVNKGLEVEGVRMAFMASERPEGIKISLRANEPDTVNDIAVRFGGGGHAQAAGCTLRGVSLEEAQEMVLAAMAEKLCP